MNAVEPEISFDVRLGDEVLAQELHEWLDEHGGSDVRLRHERGFLPLLPIVIGAVIGAGGLASVLMFIRSKTQCQVILDARGERIHKEVDCRIRDGRLIVLTKDGERVEVIEAPALLDLTELTKAALNGGADAVKQAAKAAGASVAS